jgi:FtsP/CotA-like multicopper oxidase with cupredoxin domain
VQKTRQLTLNEVLGPGGPLVLLLNNTRWDGTRGDGTIRPDFTPITLNGITNYYSELPKEGETEVWELVNLTMDAHPIHLHLTQFQIINRQHYDPNRYPAVYEAAFPGGAYIPEYGPPLDYKTGNARALGGNPDVKPYLLGSPIPPAKNEAGWKDTVMARPGMVTRIAVRYALQEEPATATCLSLPFDPFALGRGYVWHCHILDHEDNEMMRPFAVMPKTGVTRTYVQGVDY